MDDYAKKCLEIKKMKNAETLRLEAELLSWKVRKASNITMQKRWLKYLTRRARIFAIGIKTSTNSKQSFKHQLFSQKQIDIFVKGKSKKVRNGRRNEKCNGETEGRCQLLLVINTTKLCLKPGMRRVMPLKKCRMRKIQKTEARSKELKPQRSKPL